MEYIYGIGDPIPLKRVQSGIRNEACLTIFTASKVPVKKQRVVTTLSGFFLWHMVKAETFGALNDDIVGGSNEEDDKL